jgi:hypothetical protein
VPSRSQRHHRRVAVAQRAPQHLVGEAVYLEEDHARDVGGDRTGASCLTAHDVALPRLVVVDRQQCGGRRRDDRQPCGHHHAGEPAVDGGAGADRGRDGHEPAVEHDGGAAQGDHAERKGKAAERRPHEGVECRGDDRGDERSGRTVDVEVRQQRAQHDEGDPVKGEDDQATDGEAPEPGHDASVTRVRVIQPHPMRVTTPHPSGA